MSRCKIRSIQSSKMISRNIFTDIIFSVILVLLQVYLFNEINILDGKYIPVIYPILILFYPFYRNPYSYLLISFLLGLGIDAFLGCWGINCFATVMIAFFRTLIFKSSTDKESDDNFSFESIRWGQFLLFIFSNIFIHQILVHFIEYFKLYNIFKILLNATLSSIISFVFILLYILIFKIKKKV